MDTAIDLRPLVERAKEGDEEAWQHLYRTLYPRLMAFARLRLGQDEAAEAVSETVVRAIAKIHRFTWKGAGFEAWIFRILRNVVTDTYRRNGRAQTLALKEEDGYADEDCADVVLGDEQAAAVRTAFERLTPSDQEVLHLRIIQDMTSDAAAIVLGKRPGAVRMAQARALERLRAAMDEMGQL